MSHDVGIEDGRRPCDVCGAVTFRSQMRRISGEDLCGLCASVATAECGGCGRRVLALDLVAGDCPDCTAEAEYEESIRTITDPADWCPPRE